MENNDKYITVRQAADLLGVSPETVIRWILHEGLPAERIKFKSGRHRYRLLRSNVLARLEAVETCGRASAKANPPPTRGMVPVETRAFFARLGMRIGG